MRLALRAVTTTLALVSVLLAGAGAARAADPSPDPTVGGRLSALGNEVTIEAQGTLPVHVTLAAEIVSLSETEFSLAPGETRTVTFTGEALGHVYATFAVRTPGPTTADSNSLTLGVALKPYVPPFDWAPLGLAGLAVLGASFLGYRLRYVRIRIERSPA